MNYNQGKQEQVNRVFLPELCMTQFFQIGWDGESLIPLRSFTFSHASFLSVTSVGRVFIKMCSKWCFVAATW